MRNLVDVATSEGASEASGNSDDGLFAPVKDLTSGQFGQTQLGTMFAKINN